MQVWISGFLFPEDRCDLVTYLATLCTTLTCAGQPVMWDVISLITNFSSLSFSLLLSHCDFSSFSLSNACLIFIIIFQGKKTGAFCPALYIYILIYIYLFILPFFLFLVCHSIEFGANHPWQQSHAECHKWLHFLDTCGIFFFFFCCLMGKTGQDNGLGSQKKSKNKPLGSCLT